VVHTDHTKTYYLGPQFQQLLWLGNPLREPTHPTVVSYEVLTLPTHPRCFTVRQMNMAARRAITLGRVFGGLLILAFIAIILTTGTRGGARDHFVCKQSPLLAGSSVPVPVRRILQRACQDCHSEETQWPWYASAPLISWRIHSDVERGRGFLNLSKWNDYIEGERRALATAIGAAIQSDLMPPAAYIWIHHNARLSSLDQQVIEVWALGKLQSGPAIRETQEACKARGH
jgi:hypothetical protein